MPTPLSRSRSCAMSRRLPPIHRAAFWRRLAGIGLIACLATGARADVGVTTLPATDDDDPVTVFYRSAQPATELPAGHWAGAYARDATPEPGNGRLIVISLGSGGSPWGHGGLARALVAAGYVVAVPQHHADNARDGSRPGPESWARRPVEVSHAIDRMARDPRFAPLLRLDAVGVYGMSAGGHTALELAGGQWSPARFRDHCRAHMEEDFPACVGLITGLDGNLLDPLKRWIARQAIDWRFDDARPRHHTDPRIAAVVAAVPFAADFDLDTLVKPVVPLALATADGDRWLAPRFHADRVLRTCVTCEHLVALQNGGHGAYLDPLPPGLGGRLGALINDPPGFERAVEPAIEAKVVDFFTRKLAPAASAVPAPSASQ